MKSKKIDWKRLLKKATEDSIKKAIELAVMAFALGITFKFIMVSLPAFTLGSILAKIVKVRFLDSLYNV